MTHLAPLQEVSNQAGTTISVLTSFEDSFRCALLLETDVLHSLVAYLGSSHSHDAFHMASALVTLGGTQGSRCQQEVCGGDRSFLLHSVPPH